MAYSDVLLQEIYRQPTVTKELLGQAGLVCDRLRQLFQEKQFKKVFIFGSGDSYFSALAAHYAFRCMTDIPVEIFPALEFSRYAIHRTDANTLAIPISMSGTGDKIVEATLRAKANGCHIFAITNSKEGTLAKESHDALLLHIQQPASFLSATVTYTATIAVMYALALAMPPKKAACYWSIAEEQLHQIATQMGDVIKSVRDECEKLASRYAYCLRFYLLGSGPNFATALYGASKFAELTASEATAHDLEEVAHQQFWMLAKGMPVFIFAPEGEISDVGAHVAQCLTELGCKTIAIAPKGAIQQLANHSLVMPANIQEVYSPFVYQLPIQLFTFYLAKQKGLNPNTRAHLTQNPVYPAISKKLTKGSKLRLFDSTEKKQA